MHAREHPAEGDGPVGIEPGEAPHPARHEGAAQFPASVADDLRCERRTGDARPHGLAAQRPGVALLQHDPG